MTGAERLVAVYWMRLSIHLGGMQAETAGLAFATPHDTADDLRARLDAARLALGAAVRLADEHVARVVPDEKERRALRMALLAQLVAGAES